MNLSRRSILAHSILAAALLATGAATSQAAISFTGTPYTQNFDSFAGTAASLPFSNDDTPDSTGGLQGLHLYISGNQFSGAGTVATDAVQGVPDYISRSNTTTASNFNSVTYRGTGTSALTSAHYYFRTPAGSTDVALGFFNTDANSRSVGNGYISAGFALVNDTGATIDQFELKYLAEASTATFDNDDPVSVSWAINATGVGDGDGTWTTVPGMGYTSAAVGGVVTQQSVTLAHGIGWDPGETLFIRWRDANVGFTDRLSWIDDISIAIPEPTSLAAFGVAGLLARRRRQA